MKREWPRRLAVVVVLGAAALGWRGAFGLFATDRRVEWRLALPASDVRAVDLQVWRGESLIRREERQLPRGLTESLVWTVPLQRGDHQALALVTVREGAARTLRTTFDPRDADTVVLEPR
ncbi:MAG: hypothetical protein JNG84_03520 [Archangium sp.]|nr:hypothetical protein [Archangium sp.]